MPLFEVGDRMFQVNGQTWIIEPVGASNDHLRRSDGSITVAVADNNDKTIYISDLLNGKFLECVICHELVHVFSFENNLSIPIETEEIIANFMSLYGRDIIYIADDIMSSLARRIA